MSLPASVRVILEDPSLDFSQFSTWRTLFELAKQFTGENLYVTRFSCGEAVGNYEVALVANSEDAEDPVILFSSGGLSGDGGNLGGSLSLVFTPPFKRNVDYYEFGSPRIA